MKFYQNDHSKETLWRGIILFGKNVASYKFALAESLIALAAKEKNFVSLEEIAPLYSSAICRHLTKGARQGTFQSGKLLTACEKFNNGDITQGELTDNTIRYGFNHVIDAFHIVNQSEVPTRFFTDERKLSKGIMLTDELLSLGKSYQFENLSHELEARWRLVETAWTLGVPARSLQLSYTQNSDEIIYKDNTRRINVSSCRDALNGYQKGRCFYCNKFIAVTSGSPYLCDVDHFFPEKLKKDPEKFGHLNLDGVWNLVLSCKCCNRGPDGKLARRPSKNLLEKLHNRNEYYICSHHPIKETIKNQTGDTEEARIRFLQEVFDNAAILNKLWEPNGIHADDTI